MDDAGERIFFFQFRSIESTYTKTQIQLIFAKIANKNAPTLKHSSEIHIFAQTPSTHIHTRKKKLPTHRKRKEKQGRSTEIANENERMRVANESM